MKIRFFTLAAFLILLGTAKAAEVRIGAKAFTEGYILAEIIEQKIKQEFPGLQVERTFDTPSSMMLFNALKNGEIDVYPEYTGTLGEQLLKKPQLKSFAQLAAEIRPLGLVMSAGLGFDNSYALVMPRALAHKLVVKKISHLKQHPDLIAGFSFPFMERSDGFKALSKFYSLNLTRVRGMEHALTHGAIESGAIQLSDFYTTSAQLEKMDVEVLEDDRGFFPKYYAFFLARQDFVERHPKVWASLGALAGRFDQRAMIGLNSLVDLEGKSIESVAKSFLSAGQKELTTRGRIQFAEIWSRTLEHLFLVMLSLLASILVGIPLGLLATRNKTLSQIVLGISGAIQTIPSLALLCFMIPLIGIGTLPALVALFLYGLLPIVRNTYTGLKSVNPNLLQISQILGLNRKQRINWIEIPLAAPAITAGIKTSAVINVGTATLAAFIGAGGYGSFIVIGLALNDIPTILHGAIPAALLALLLQAAFEALDKIIIPRGVRLQTRS